MSAPDFTVDDHGSIWLLTPNTDAAKDWVSENLPDDTPRIGPACAVEHRYIQPIVEGIVDAGFAVA